MMREVELIGSYSIVKEALAVPFSDVDHSGVLLLDGVVEYKHASEVQLQNQALMGITLSLHHHRILGLIARPVHGVTIHHCGKKAVFYRGSWVCPL